MIHIDVRKGQFFRIYKPRGVLIVVIDGLLALPSHVFLLCGVTLIPCINISYRTECNTPNQHYHSHGSAAQLHVRARVNQHVNNEIGVISINYIVQ